MRDASAISYMRPHPEHLRRVAGLRWDWAVAAGHVARDTRDRFVDDFQSWCEARQNSHLCLVALDADDKVVGFGFVVLTARVPTANVDARCSADVQAVFVTPEFRNAGIGGQLVEQLVTLARDHEAEHITVHSSPAAVTAYERAGFVHDPLMMNRTP